MTIALSVMAFSLPLVAGNAGAQEEGAPDPIGFWPVPVTTSSHSLRAMTAATAATERTGSSEGSDSTD